MGDICSEVLFGCERRVLDVEERNPHSTREQNP